jgi:hypothetical protein
VINFADMPKLRWLSSKELRLLADQEGPLQGTPLFDDMWSEDYEVGEEFLSWVQRTQLGTFVYWEEQWPEERLKDYRSEGLCALEGIVCAGSAQPIGEFIDDLPHERAKTVVAGLRKVLKTTGKEPPPVMKAPRLVLDKKAAWTAGTLRRDLTNLHHKPSSSRRTLVEQLGVQLDKLGMSKERAQTKALLKAEPLDVEAVYAFVWGLELPIAEPVVHELRRWLWHVSGRSPNELAAIIERRWRPLIEGLDEDFKNHALDALKAEHLTLSVAPNVKIHFTLSDTPLVNIFRDRMTVDEVRRAIEQGATVNGLARPRARARSTPFELSTPLHQSLLLNDSAVAELLIGKGADLEACDEHGRRPIDVAISEGKRTFIELLLKNRATTKHLTVVPAKLDDLFPDLKHVEPVRRPPK